MKSIIVGLLLSLSLTGCDEIFQTKPLSPAETQLIVQVAANHGTKGISPEAKAVLYQAVVSARATLTNEVTNPQEVLGRLTVDVGAEYADVLSLALVLVQERVNISAMPDTQARPYVDAILAGLEVVLSRA